MLNKPILLVILVLSSFCCLFGYLSYSFYGSKVKAETQLETLVNINKNIESSLVKKEEECKISDQLVSEWQKDKQASDKQKDSDIQKIDKLPAKKPVEAVPNEIDVVDIDGKLPESLRLLLQQSYNRDKGSASDDT